MSNSTVTKDVKQRTESALAAARLVKKKQVKLLKQYNEALSPSDLRGRETIMTNTDMLNTPRLTQDQLHTALSEVTETVNQVSYLHMSGDDIVGLVTQYPNSSFTCMYAGKPVSISSPNGATATISYGAGRSMGIGSDVTLCDLLLLSVNTKPTVAEITEDAKCLTSVLQCLDANAPNNDTHIGGPI